MHLLVLRRPVNYRAPSLSQDVGSFATESRSKDLGVKQPPLALHDRGGVPRRRLCRTARLLSAGACIKTMNDYDGNCFTGR